MVQNILKCFLKVILKFWAKSETLTTKCFQLVRSFCSFLFVICSFFVQFFFVFLWVFCSFHVFCPFFVHYLFVFCSFFVRCFLPIFSFRVKITHKIRITNVFNFLFYTLFISLGMSKFDSGIRYTRISFKKRRCGNDNFEIIFPISIYFRIKMQQS